MQPFQAIVRPRSESTIGWAPASVRSMILRRRCPRAIRPCDQVPAASGPLRAITEVIADTAATSGTRPSSRTSPVAPHISSTLPPAVPACAMRRVANADLVDSLSFHRWGRHGLSLLSRHLLGGFVDETWPLVDYYLRILHFNRRLPLNFDLGPLHIHLYARSVFFMWVTVVILVIAGIAVLESARLVKLGKADTYLLLGLAVAYPLAAWLHPPLLRLAPVVVLACALPSVFSGDVEHGGRRTTFTAFGSVWICWSLAHLVMLWSDAYLVCFAAAATDVAAWCGGKGLRHFRWARRPLSPLSPNKTVGGLVGAVIGAFLVLTLLGTISVGLLIAVAFGGVLGDLVESMVKRQAQVKDAGTWLPGFGGLLDRIDSLLLVLPLAYLLG